MNSLIKTLKYCFRNFFPLSVGAIIPAALWGFFTLLWGTESRGKGKSFFGFIFEYKDLKIGSFQDIADYTMNLGLFRYVFPILLLLLFLTVCVSLLISSIENHMRMGKFSYRDPILKLNNSFTSVIPVVITGLALILLWQFLLTGALLLNHLLIAGLNQTPNAATIIVAFLIIVIFILLFAYVAMFLLLIAPTKLMVGYSFKDALAYAIHLSAKSFGSLYLATVFPFIVLLVYDLLIWLLPDMGAYLVILNILLYHSAIIYYVSFAMVSFFELGGFTRKDLVRKKFFS